MRKLGFDQSGLEAAALFVLGLDPVIAAWRSRAQVRVAAK